MKVMEVEPDRAIMRRDGGVVRNVALPSPKILAKRLKSYWVGLKDMNRGAAQCHGEGNRANIRTGIDHKIAGSQFCQQSLLFRG